MADHGYISDDDADLKEAIRQSLLMAGGGRESPEIKVEGKKKEKAKAQDIIVIVDSDEELDLDAAPVVKKEVKPEPKPKPTASKPDPFEELKKKAQRVNDYSRDGIGSSSLSPSAIKKPDPFEELMKRSQKVNDYSRSDFSASKSPTSKPERPTSSIFGIDRAAMEAERLARLKKRKLDVPESNQRAKSPRMQSSTPASRSNIHTLSSLASNIKQEGGSSGVKREVKGEEGEGEMLEMQFPQGVVKKTFIEGRKRGGDDITIEEVFQRVCMQEDGIDGGVLDLWG